MAKGKRSKHEKEKVSKPKSKSKAKETKKDIKNKEEKEETANKEKKNSNTEKNIVKLEEIKNVIDKKKKIPKGDLQKIIKPVFYNILIAIAIIIYFVLLIFGFQNIKSEVYITDLKVFSISILFLAIVLIEKAYKKDSGKIAIYGIETIIIAFATICLVYVDLMQNNKYIISAMIILYVFAIYYVLKSMIVYINSKKKYFVDNMKEIIKDEEES